MQAVHAYLGWKVQILPMKDPRGIWSTGGTPAMAGQPEPQGFTPRTGHTVTSICGGKMNCP